MKKAIKINIQEPCHENWNLMTPNTKGRFCNSCQKTVIDFTTKTDRQIATITSTQTNLCGRFRSTQLNKNLPITNQKSPFATNKVFAALLAVSTISIPSLYSQGKIKKDSISIVESHKLPTKKQTSILKEKLFYGRVLDQDQLPLLGANIIIKGTSTGIQSDFDGEFSLKVKQGDTLIISYITMKTIEYVLEEDSKNTFNLTMNDQLKGEIQVVTVGISTVTTINRINPRHWLRLMSYKKHYRRDAVDQGNYTRTGFGSFLYEITNIFR
ncbi:MAG: hypothetical protein BM564_07435 [Bacteroidetes bacterium MedPE-SWsnd-G2]|nr:MAG: hypothetical protein BM564_07435 [Bacteroidetes bacterium MedPE-SWsnd-G2]